MSKLKNLARRAGASAARGLKGTAMTGGAGSAAYFAHKFLNQKVQTLNKSPFITPALLVVGGHFLKRKNADLGNGLIGAGGYALGMAIDVYRLNQQAKETSAIVGPEHYETRALVEPSDIREFDDPMNPLDISSAMSI
jgi:hypothetical protein